MYYTWVYKSRKTTVSNFSINKCKDYYQQECTNVTPLNLAYHDIVFIYSYRDIYNTALFISCFQTVYNSLDRSSKHFLSAPTRI